MDFYFFGGSWAKTRNFHVFSHKLMHSYINQQELGSSDVLHYVNILFFNMMRSFRRFLLFIEGDFLASCLIMTCEEACEACLIKG